MGASNRPKHPPIALDQEAHYRLNSLPTNPKGILMGFEGQGNFIELLDRRKKNEMVYAWIASQDQIRNNNLSLVLDINTAKEA